MARHTSRYASGKKAWGECGRSGKRVPLNSMVRDGDSPQLLVAPDWWEPQHPQEIVIPVDDAVALENPTTDLDAGTTNVDEVADPLVDEIGGTTFGS